LPHICSINHDGVRRNCEFGRSLKKVKDFSGTTVRRIFVPSITTKKPTRNHYG
jgi:hypothetical protein